MKPDLSAARLRELLHYDQITGVFTWRISRHTAKAGDVAGSATGNGYWRVKLDKRQYKAHRLAWLYVTGEWPEGHLDHKNRVRSDNAFLNLRPCTQMQNTQNRPARRGTATGVKGVTLSEEGNFMARISVNKRVRYLGTFKSLEHAKRVYNEAASTFYKEFAHINP